MDAPAIWLTDVTESVLLTHRPTGVRAEGATRDAALWKLAAELMWRGDISVNDARAAHGLPPFAFLPTAEDSDEVFAGRVAKALGSPQVRAAGHREALRQGARSTRG